MVWTFETLLVELCAPTLMGQKPASLFRYSTIEEENVFDEVEDWNKKMQRFGIRFVVLKKCCKSDSYLIYVYRKKLLDPILKDAQVEAFLLDHGYEEGDSLEGMLQTLSSRLCVQESFPHEIGIFLGYPLEDVIGFIENEGRNCTCCGYWKVYGNPIHAKRKFSIYDTCTSYCKKLFAHGISVPQLAVAI